MSGAPAPLSRSPGASDRRLTPAIRVFAVPLSAALPVAVLLFALLLSGLLLLARPLEAAEADYDVAVRMGAVSGTLTDLTSNKAQAVNYSFGGIPVAIALGQSRSSKLSTDTFFEAVLDFTNQQVSRESLGLGLSYFIFGGFGDYTVIDRGAYSVQSTSGTWGLAARSQASLAHYSVVTQSKAATSAASSAPSVLDMTQMEAQIGLDVVYNRGPLACLGLDVLETLISLPASSQRFSSKSTEILFYWRRRL